MPEGRETPELREPQHKNGYIPPLKSRFSPKEKLQSEEQTGRVSKKI